jgi:hypothetical protein
MTDRAARLAVRRQRLHNSPKRGVLTLKECLVFIDWPKRLGMRISHTGKSFVESGAAS